ncbi:MAG: hypothetical protein J0J15_12550, partial [Mesorhizobium sp.]|nr:hypothetical protein [Mesorhizobium sp.]
LSSKLAMRAIGKGCGALAGTQFYKPAFYGLDFKNRGKFNKMETPNNERPPKVANEVRVRP